jgi:signal transduction histidine kinase
MVITEDTRHAHIRFSTHIIKRLGEELNPSIDQSILELVKNSYDANATTCVVTLSNVAEVGGSIDIDDNGDGMDANGIIDGWLVLGQSSKSSSVRTRLGRIPAGSKGLGRLAALRMGSKAELESVPRLDRNSKYYLSINWYSFDNARLVDDVTLDVQRVVQVRKFRKGTRIQINELKNSISQREIKRIARGLILLADPFDDDPNSFKPVLVSPEFKEMEELVSRRYFNDADYHLVASIDQKGNARAQVLDYLGNELFAASHKELIDSKKGQIYQCPPTSFNMWAFILDSTNFNSRQTSLSEVREWLAEFGGVHLYENGLRVNPYGNPGNDWLDMNLARVKSPEERPGTNTSIGVVRVEDSLGLLSQKTDRSGFIENEVFHEIRRFCHDALEWMAKRRIEQAERRRRRERTHAASAATATKEKVQETINTVGDAGQREELQRVFSKYQKAQQDEVKTLKAEVQLYRTLSTAGITTATFSHESRGNPLKVISLAVKTIARRAKARIGDEYEEVFSRQVLSITKAVKSLNVLGSATLKLLSHEKRRVTRIEIHKVVEELLETFQPFLEGRAVEVRTQFCQGNPYMRATRASIESILTNLINNSVAALEASTNRERHILIKTHFSEGYLIVTISDNGPGIKDIKIRDIWLPGYSTSPNGTGLGLTIVRDAVSDLGGRVAAIAKGELGGAEMQFTLPIISL